MRWSHVSLSSILAIALFSLSHQANAYPSTVYSYDGMGIQAVPLVNGVVAPTYRDCYRVGSKQGVKRYSCRTRSAFYVCQKYTYEITPQHRDVDCTEWRVKWLRVYGERYYYRYGYYGNSYFIR